EFQILGARHEARHEHQRRRDWLGGRGEMLAEPHLVEAERVGVERFFLVLGERLGERARRRMHRHHEYPEAHVLLPYWGLSPGLSCSAKAEHPVFTSRDAFP